MNESIELSRHDNGVAVLTFTRPDAMNALTLEAMTAFQQAVDSLVDDESLRVLIVTGAGDKAFCSGGDLAELSQFPSADDARQFITTMGDILLTLERLPVPVIAAVNGYALGGGSEIALACDMRIVDENVKMGMVHINMGVTPGWGGGQRLLRLVGYARAMQLLINGDVLRAYNLRELGLANEVTAPGQALQTTLKLAETIAHQPPAVIRSIKALLQAGLNQTYKQALLTERDLFPALWADEPHAKAVEAFLARQKSKRSHQE